MKDVKLGSSPVLISVVDDVHMEVGVNERWGSLVNDLVPSNSC